MSKIDKLSILGVRSFDNNSNEVIKFYTPLTLIVGYNGSGKTTIIECLKYATTGDLPPNTKGGAFIHDPKLCGEKEVLAQVKLSFKSTSGASMVATRSLQLTVQKTVRRQKTLEGQLLMLRGGERLAVSSRVAELDQIMPQHLGVSKAILDNVIFCHQDESLWPMSEPSVLKKKFDEIFEALKYTKAIDNIKILRKQRNEELGKLKIIEQHAKDDKDQAEKADRRSRELSNEIESLQTQLRTLATAINDATEHAASAWKSFTQFERITNQLETKRTQAQIKQESVNDLKKHIREMRESDQELHAMLESYDERTQNYQSQIEEKKGEYHELDKVSNAQRETLGNKQAEQGRLQAEKDHYDRQVKTRETLVKETARRHNMLGFDYELNDERVQDFMERISRMAKEQQTAFERAREEIQSEHRAIQITLNKLHERKSALNQNKENCRMQTSANERKITHFQSNMASVQVDEGSKSRLDSSRKETSAKLDRAKIELEDTGIDLKIKHANLELRELEDQKDQLDDELVQATRQASDTAAIDVIRKSLKENEGSLETMKRAHGDRIAKILGSSWDNDNLETAFQNVSDSRSEAIKDAERQRDGASRELSQLDFRLNSLQTELQNKEKQKAKCENVVTNALDGDTIEDYHNVLKDLESSRDICKSDLEGYTHLKNYYDSCSKFFKERDTCRLCERSFNSDSERTRFRKKLEKIVSEAMKSLGESELETFEADLKRVKEAGPSFETWTRLTQTEIPSLCAEMERLKPQHEKLMRELEDQGNIIAERLSAKREIETWSKTVQDILKYKNEITSLEKQAEELSAKQALAGLARSASVIHDEQRALADRIRDLKKMIASHMDERDRLRNLISVLTNESHELDAKLRSVDHQLERRNEFISQIEELEATNRKHRESLKGFDEEMHELAPQISQEQAKIDHLERLGAEKSKTLQEQANKLSDSVNRLETASADIKSYIEREGPSQLHQVYLAIVQLQSDQESSKQSMKDVTIKINELQKQQSTHEEMRRQINDNIRYRENLASLASVQAEIDSLTAQNAHEDRDRYRQEATKWEIEHRRLTGESASLTGQMTSKDDQLMQLLNDWNTEYKDAAFNYKKAHIKVEATKAAVEDLARYASALDKAIMTYHSLKMEEINRIIEELWKKTYQGTDVDTILIRSEGETAAGNKSYNYRVCMVKQDAEMDMRGRCSAGQRVLASIIIRLALAECFGVNCGLIALDEPTTNLDQDNIRSLAESLHDIIKSRQAQSNFQLIVITHDEEFLRYMQCAEFCDYYYRISRNISQKSIIERQAISEVL